MFKLRVWMMLLKLLLASCLSSSIGIEVFWKGTSKLSACPPPGPSHKKQVFEVDVSGV